MRIEVIILAAGAGSRLRSTKPKVLQTLGGRPLLDYLVDAADRLNPRDIHVVVGHGAGQVRKAFSHRTDLNFVEQPERLGTGHAVQQVVPFLQDDSRVLVLLGDCPLVEPSTLQELCKKTSALTILSAELNDPFGYGRIKRSAAGKVLAIVEERDASDDEKEIREINTGLISADAARLKEWLSLLKNENIQKEYLLTDIVSYAYSDGSLVEAFRIEDHMQVKGVNTYSQLAELERTLQNKKAEELMRAGVQVMDPARLDIRGTVKVGKGVIIDINVLLEGEVEIGDDVSIGPNCVIKNAIIKKGSEIRANTMIDGASIGAGCIVGPFARLRPGSELAAEVHVGNFVEVKKSKIGKNSKANHLAYLGDAEVGESVNVGAGTITCNYDGVNKHETVIGDGAFIGTNSSLVAPVEIGRDATIGAGSTITKNVEANTLAVGRGKQISVTNWRNPKKIDPENP